MINPEKISILERTHRLVVEFAGSYPRELVAKKPSPEAFSATEIVYHLADVERLWHNRFNELQAKESGVVFVAINPDALAVLGKYNEKPLADGLRDWTELRQKTFEIARTLPEEVLHRTAVHSRYGEMVIFRMFDIMANHDLQHLEQLKRTLKLVTA
jgi:hypothetical protein